MDGILEVYNASLIGRFLNFEVLSVPLWAWFSSVFLGFGVVNVCRRDFF